MGSEKLTVETVVEKIIWNEIVAGSSGTKNNTKSAQELMKVFLKQIRTDLYKNADNTNGTIGIGCVSKVFANYLNLE